MNKLKMVIVYGVIIVLCIAALTSFLVSKRTEAVNTETDSSTVAAASTQTETASADTTTAEKTATDQALDSIPEKVQAIMKKTAETPDPNPIIGVGRGKDFAGVTRDAIEKAGGLKDIIKQGDTVLIKPNMIKAALPEAGIVTDYRVVQEIANIARECGAARVIVADGSPWNKSFDGDAEAYKKISGVELFDFNDCKEEDCYKLRPINGLGKVGFFIPKLYMDADVVITAAKLKTHYEAVVTLGLKNVFGVPPLYMNGSGFLGKEYLHGLGLPIAIVDLNKVRKPDFTVIDGIIGGEGNMPISGTPVASEIVFAGKDIVAADTAALTFMGFTVEDVPHVKLAGEQGLGISDLSKIKVIGAELEKIKMQFKKSESY
jgi:uncharacterized protein (DUF362 family)